MIIVVKTDKFSFLTIADTTEEAREVGRRLTRDFDSIRVLIIRTDNPNRRVNYSKAFKLVWAYVEADKFVTYADDKDASEHFYRVKGWR